MALPTETQEYNIENQVLGGRQIGGGRALKPRLWRLFIYVRKRQIHL